MDGWTGFSDADLKKLKNGTAPQRGKTAAMRVRRGGGRPTPQRSLSAKTPSVAETQALAPEQRLTPQQDANSSETKHAPQESHTEPAVNKVVAEEPDPAKNDVKTVTELEASEGVSRDIGQLEKYRLQQKIMEEQNKQKKALLAQAITARRARAQNEAAKLTQVQQQLLTLDQMLTADVRIIRDKIETASVEFLEAQRRYNRAEQEFVSAKVDLHEKSETKEQLTEHLYTIIHQNELRKAKKLAELMEELAMEEADTVTTATMELPPLPPTPPSVVTTKQPSVEHHAAGSDVTGGEGHVGKVSEGHTEKQADPTRSKEGTNATGDTTSSPAVTSSIPGESPVTSSVTEESPPSAATSSTTEDTNVQDSK